MFERSTNYDKGESDNGGWIGDIELKEELEGSNDGAKDDNVIPVEAED